MNIHKNVFLACALAGLFSIETSAATITPHTRTKVPQGSYTNYTVYENFATAGLSQPVVKKIKVLYDLAAPSYGSIKDTKMLVTTWGSAADALGFNEMTTEGHMYNGWSDDRKPMLYRCWAIAAYNLYHYFYNKFKSEKTIVFPSNFKPMTQDEMVFWGSYVTLERPGYDAFRLEYGGTKENILALFKKIFNNESAEQKILSNGLAASNVTTYLKKGKPLYVSIEHHSMLIDAMAEDDNGKKLIHCINFDNHGTEGYIYLDQLNAKSWVTYEIPTTLVGSDTAYPVTKDSDNDGVCDFDEKYRFNTNPKENDTDRDGINDFAEIHGKTVRLMVNVNYLYNPNTNAVDFLSLSANYGHFGEMNRKLEEIKPEKTSNTDGDNRSDGYEDKNRNGLWDDGETDPYLNDSDYPGIQTATENVPGGYTIYAYQGTVEVQKNVKCWNASSKPTFASYLNEMNDYRPLYQGCLIASDYTGASGYAVNIGENARVGMIDTKGNVKLGNKAVSPFVYFYKAVDAGSMAKSSSAINYGHVFLGGGAWRYKVQKPASFDAGTTDVYVYSGETFKITPSTHIRSLVVENGGTVILDNGDLYVGSITLYKGSKVKFTNIGYRTTLHANGLVNWSATFVKPSGAANEDMTAQFALMQHSSYNVNVDNTWYGTIFAPGSAVRLGKSSAISAYGRFLGGKVYVYESSSIYYSPLQRKVVMAKTSSNDVTKPAISTLVQSRFGAEISGNLLTVSNIPEGHRVDIVDVRGKLVSKMVSNGHDLHFTLPAAGKYVVHSGNQSKVFTVK